MTSIMKWYVLVVLTVVHFVACDGSVEEQEDFRDQAFRTPSGFTQTNDRGEVLSQDPDDWRVAPAYFERLVINPAFPNPVPSGVMVTIPIRLRFNDTVRGGLDLVSYDANRIPRSLDRLPDARNPGAYVLRFRPDALGVQGLLRVYILDTAGGLISYGDLKIGE